MAKLKTWWRGIVDDIQILGARWVGVVASIMMPSILALTLGQWWLPTLADLARVVGALIIAVILQSREAANTKEGDVAVGRTSKAAMKRRRRAGFTSGFAWQAGIAELQRLVQPAVVVALHAIGIGGVA